MARGMKGPGPPCRSTSHLYGLPNLAPKLHAQVLEANRQVRWMGLLASTAAAVGAPVVIENPQSSRVRQTRSFRALPRQGFEATDLDYCLFDKKVAQPTPRQLPGSAGPGSTAQTPPRLSLLSNRCSSCPALRNGFRWRVQNLCTPNPTPAPSVEPWLPRCPGATGRRPGSGAGTWGVPRGHRNVPRRPCAVGRRAAPLGQPRRPP
jgi:hypothetical protein